MSKSKPKPKSKPDPATAAVASPQPGTDQDQVQAPADKAAPKQPAPRKPASGYTPVGKVKVLAESTTERVLMDDLRVWKEPVR